MSTIIQNLNEISICDIFFDIVTLFSKIIICQEGVQGIVNDVYLNGY